MPFEVVNDSSELLDMTGSVSENKRANSSFVGTQTAQTAGQTAQTEDANSANENSLWGKQKGISPRRQIAEGGGVTDANTTLDMDGENYTLRTLKTLRQAYQKRSQDPATRIEARSANHAKWSKINALILDHENSKSNAGG